MVCIPCFIAVILKLRYSKVLKFSGGSRNFEKGGRAIQKRGGGCPKIDKKKTKHIFWV
jgi:hypothetical protein